LEKTSLKRERNMTMNCWGKGGQQQFDGLGDSTTLPALTAMSALSASIYSCGGDAGLFGRGGEEGALIASGFGAGLKYLFSPVG
jgi:hypothetical protein